MMSKRIISIYIIVLTAPVWLYVLWLLKEKQPLNVFILDKTVANLECDEHRAFNWVMNHEKITKPSGDFYIHDRDYFGFFPIFDTDTSFKTRTIDHLHSNALMHLASQIDVCYYTDTYGIYDIDLYQRKLEKNRASLLYGGTTENEVALLGYMKYYEALILLEFNLFASPTTEKSKRHLENLIGLDWSGWTGRYFDDLDTAKSKDLPKWLVRNYLDQNDGEWPYKKDGIVFVNNWSRVVVLENEEALNFPVPKIITPKENQLKYGLPDTITYPFWFEVSSPRYENVSVFSKYEIETNEKGDSLLELYSIPKSFPAVYENRDIARLYYFAGDFSDVEVSLVLSRLKYIENFDKLFVDLDEDSDRKLFFWKYYLPLVTKLLKEQQKISNRKVVR